MLLGETAQQVGEAQRELARIGIDRPAAAAPGRSADSAGGAPLRSFPVATFAAFKRPATWSGPRRTSTGAAR